MIEQNKVNKENKCYKSPVEELRQPQLLLIQLNKELCFKLSREERNTKSPASNKPGLAYLTKNEKMCKKKELKGYIYLKSMQTNK